MKRLTRQIIATAVEVVPHEWDSIRHMCNACHVTAHCPHSGCPPRHSVLSCWLSVCISQSTAEMLPVRPVAGPWCSKMLYHPLTKPAAVSFDILDMLELNWLVAWHSGRTSVFGRRTFPVLQSTCS